MLGALIGSGIIYLYEVVTRIDFGFDKDYGIKNTRLKK
jgi:hypothetical protein